MTTKGNAPGAGLIGDTAPRLTQADTAWLSSAIRVGIDVTVVSQVRESIERFGDRYLNRIFTAHELECCENGRGHPSPERLAARFAAKEATVKVLRVPVFQPAWTEMEVSRHPTGWCEMTLSGSAQAMAKAEGILQPLSLGLTHEGDLAMAVVITFSEASCKREISSRFPGLSFRELAGAIGDQFVNESEH